MLSFEVFSEMVTRWKHSVEEIYTFEEAMSPFFERSPIVTMNQDVRDALSQLICIECGLKKDSDILWWWAFENVDKKITVKDRGKETVYDVSTLEGLYKYILDGNERDKSLPSISSIEQAEIIICRKNDTIDALNRELFEVYNKFHKLEEAVNTEASCWMCEKNSKCHPSDVVGSPDISCGAFQFDYKRTRRKEDKDCPYLNGTKCWGQNDKPSCDSTFIKCPDVSSKNEQVINFGEQCNERTSEDNS